MREPPNSIPEIHFRNPRLAQVGVEAMTLAELRQRATTRMLSASQRVNFIHLLFILKGRSRHMVDFVDYPLQAGTILMVRPGQVQRWHLTDELQGQLTLISAEALFPGTHARHTAQELLALDQWPSAALPAPADFQNAVADNGRLRLDIDNFNGKRIDAAIIQHELLTLLLRLSGMVRGAVDAPELVQAETIYRLFCMELEAHFKSRPSVLDLAERIGFSESTLSRACVAKVGRTAKHEIDRRIALEAKRLLVHSKASIAEIGHDLGFTEATNFVKFFKRMAGVAPVAFRTGERIG